MNFFYKMKDHYETYDDVSDYYDNRYVFCMLNYVWYNTPYTKKCVQMQNNSYMYNPANAIYYKEFVGRIKNSHEYVQQVNRVVSENIDVEQTFDKDFDTAYYKFWNSSINSDIIAKITISNTTNNVDNYIEEIKKFNYPKRKYVMHGIDKYKNDTKELSSTRLNTIIDTVSNMLDVNIKQGWTVFRLFGLRWFNIYDDSKYVGGFYLKVDNKRQPSITYPMGYGRSLVEAHSEPAMVHELVHAVQFCYHPSYLDNRLEIDAICLENHLYPYTDIHKSMYFAHAIADHTTNNADDFNEVFCKTLGVEKFNYADKSVGYLVNRGKFMPYAIGLLKKFNLTDIVNSVKSH